MGRVTVAMASVMLLLLCVGASRLIAAETAGKHGSFAAFSYDADSNNHQGDKNGVSSQLSSSQYPKDEAAPTTQTSAIPDRYPTGYPSTANKQFNSVDQSGDRYPHGYYSDPQYPGSNQLPTSQKSFTDSTAHYSAVDNKETNSKVTRNNPTDTVPDRYPQGYYAGTHNIGGNPSRAYSGQHYNTGQQFPTSSVDYQQQTSGERYPDGYYSNSQHETVNPPESRQYDGTSYSTQSSVDPAGERYPHGYFPNAEHNIGSYRQQSSNPSTVSPQFNGARYSSETTNPAEGQRYPHGYYSDSQFHPGTSSNPSAVFNLYNGARYSGSMNEQPQQTVLYPTEAERYPNGYYPNTQSLGASNSQPKPVTRPDYSFSNYQEGNFNTFPFSNNAGEVPFEQTGGGCRTAYWIDHVAEWPKFFTVKSTVADAFGTKSKEVFGETTILQGLLKYGTDPYSELLRSGCTALLNSYSRGAYKIPHAMVIENFNAALVSKEAATAQALTFETANVESISAGNACT